MRIVEFTHGEIYRENEGHFIHANNVTKAFSKYFDILVLQYLDNKNKKNSGRIVYQNLKVYKKLAVKDGFLKNFLTFDPFFIFKEQLNSTKEFSKYRNEIKNADYVLLQGCLLISAFIYSKIKRKRIIIDTHWVNYDVALSKRGANTVAYLARICIWYVIEFIFFHLAHSILVVSAKDFDSVRKKFHIRSDKICLIPQVINFDKYKQESGIEILRDDKYEAVVTFIGSLKSIQNQHAVEYIKNRLAPKLRNCLFLVIGAETLVEINNLRILPYQKNIQQFLNKSDILISPVDVGSGTKFKMLDYLYSEKLIIGTDENFDGIPDVKKLDGVISSSLIEFDRTLEAAINRGLHKKNYEHNKMYVLKNHSLDSLVKEVGTYYAKT